MVIFGLTKISSRSNKCGLLLLRWVGGPVNLEIHSEGIIIFVFLVIEVHDCREKGRGWLPEAVPQGYGKD